MTERRPLWWIVGLILLTVIWLDNYQKVQAAERHTQRSRQWDHCIKHDAPWDCPR